MKGSLASKPENSILIQKTDEDVGNPPVRRAGGQSASGSFLQSRFWARFKGKTGWDSLRFTLGYDRSPDYSLEVSVLVRTSRLGFSFAYVPHGPERVPEEVDARVFLETFAERVKSFLGKRCVFIRFDLPWEAESGSAASLLNGVESGNSRLVKGEEVQVPDTVILGLGRDRETILAGMKPKWRYNIKLANKKGVEISEGGVEGLPIFYDLYKQTSSRDKITIHPESYYRKLFEAASESGLECPERPAKLRLWIARHGGESLAAIITLELDKRASYLYGASSDAKRNLMPSYALQWGAICAANDDGCSDYDFFGIPPEPDPTHPMYGLYQFKTGFGGRVVHRIGSYDYAYRRALYKFINLSEKLRRFWFKRVVKFFRSH